MSEKSYCQKSHGHEWYNDEWYEWYNDEISLNSPALREVLANQGRPPTAFGFLLVRIQLPKSPI